MNYTTIPNTDLKPSVICLGTADLGATVEKERAFALLDAYLGQGGNWLDTASVYANWIPGPKSVSEKTLGEWMARRGNRGQIILATKGGHPDLSTMHISRLSRQEIIHDLEASLQNLRTDVIDLYWLHRDDPQRPVGEIVQTLNDQIKAGKIRYLGCSNWHAGRIQAAQEYAAQHGLHGFVANQMLWNLARIAPERVMDKTIALMDGEMWDYHRSTGLAAVPYSSQANGLFQKLQQGKLERIGRGALAMYDLDETRRRLERAQRLSGETGLSLTQVVLGYLLSQPFTTVPIVGCKTIEQLNDSLQAAQVRLTPEQVRYLETGT